MSACGGAAEACPLLAKARAAQITAAAAAIRASRVVLDEQGSKGHSKTNCRDRRREAEAGRIAGSPDLAREKAGERPAERVETDQPQGENQRRKSNRQSDRAAAPEIDFGVGPTQEKHAANTDKKPDVGQHTERSKSRPAESGSASLPRLPHSRCERGQKTSCCRRPDARRRTRRASSRSRCRRREGAMGAAGRCAPQPQPSACRKPRPARSA